MATPVNIAIIGVGGVGAAFVGQLANILRQYPHAAVRYIARRSKSLQAPSSQGIALASWKQDLNASNSPPLDAAGLIDFLKSIRGWGVVVDNTSDQAVADAYPLFLAQGISVVTPNKKAFSRDQAFWDDMFSKVRSASHPQAPLLYHESSVGAGLPTISTLNDLVNTGDRVNAIEGVFSGTLSYLFNLFTPATGTSTRRWSEIVAEAQSLGYTEPDPRDDLNGMDVARKLVILSRLAGVQVAGTDAFPVKSLVPGALDSVQQPSDFIAQLPNHDDEMDALRSKAQSNGEVLRYRALMRRSSSPNQAPELNVSMVAVPTDSPLAGLEGADSLFCFYTDRYGKTPMIIRGAGAGAEPTAMGVSSDLIKVLERLQ